MSSHYLRRRLLIAGWMCDSHRCSSSALLQRCFSCVCLHQSPLRFKPVFFFARRPSWTRPCLLIYRVWVRRIASVGRVTWPFLLLDFPEPIPPHIVYISWCCVNKLRCYFKVFRSCAWVRSFMLDTDGHMDACFRQQYVVTSNSTYKYTGVWTYMNNVGLQINRVHDDYKHVWSVFSWMSHSIEVSWSVWPAAGKTRLSKLYCDTGTPTVTVREEGLCRNCNSYITARSGWPKVNTLIRTNTGSVQWQMGKQPLHRFKEFTNNKNNNRLQVPSKICSSGLQQL